MLKRHLTSIWKTVDDRTGITAMVGPIMKHRVP